MIDAVHEVRAVLNVATALTWVRETQGANRGEMVNAMLARVHLPPGQPWCAAFCAWVGWAVLRDRWPLPMVGGCASLGEAAAKKGLLRDEPVPGAVFLLWSDQANRFRHTGFITAQQGHDLFATVEGNTSPDGSPEGTGVFVRARRFGPKDRFIWWWQLPAAALSLPQAA
jgi:hypothetical protein